MINHEQILDRLRCHKVNMTTTRDWDHYARDNNLPSSSSLINYFGSWNTLKESLGLVINNPFYDIDELLKIAEENKLYFTSKRNWNDYAISKGLPSSSTYIKNFGSWNAVKDKLDIDYVLTTREPIYTKELIYELLKQHGNNLVNRKQWDEHAKRSGLPTYKTIRQHFSWDEVLMITGSIKRRNFSKKDLFKIIEDHQKIFFSSSINNWNYYARQNELPSSSVFIRMFGTWNQAKEALKI